MKRHNHFLYRHVIGELFNNWPEYLTFSRKLKKLDRFRVLRTIHLWFHWYDRQVMKELNNANLCSFIYSWTRTWQLEKLIIGEMIFFQCSWLLMFSIFSSAYFVVSGLDKNLLESWFNDRFKMIKSIYIMVIRGQLEDVEHQLSTL